MSLSKYALRKGAYLGRLCPRAHVHEDQKSWRTGVGCLECADERTAKWNSSPVGRLAAKATKQRNKTQVRVAQKVYRQRAKERIAKYNREYAKLNPDWHAAYYRDYNAKRKAVKLRAIPAWADLNEITALYKTAQQLTTKELQYHVDHIVPLVSELVCGLHCEANLRIITQTENCTKGNRWWPDMP